MNSPPTSDEGELNTEACKSECLVNHSDTYEKAKLGFLVQVSVHFIWESHMSDTESFSEITLEVQEHSKMEGFSMCDDVLSEETTDYDFQGPLDNVEEFIEGMQNILKDCIVPQSFDYFVDESGLSFEDEKENNNTNGVNGVSKDLFHLTVDKQSLQSVPPNTPNHDSESDSNTDFDDDDDDDDNNDDTETYEQEEPEVNSQEQINRNASGDNILLAI